jgi:hypothetical protein
MVNGAGARELNGTKARFEETEGVAHESVLFDSGQDARKQIQITKRVFKAVQDFVQRLA